MLVEFGKRCGDFSASSAAFVRDRYAVQAIPTVETNGCVVEHVSSHTLAM